MAAQLFDSTANSQAQEAMDFIANILEVSTEYSTIGKNLDGKILLGNDGSHEFYRRCGYAVKRHASSKRISVCKGDENETKQIH